MFFRLKNTVFIFFETAQFLERCLSDPFNPFNPRAYPCSRHDRRRTRSIFSSPFKRSEKIPLQLVYIIQDCYFVFQVDITELCPSATVLAQQLTHVELERLSYIGPEEFVQAFAKVSVSPNKITYYSKRYHYY